jgi:pilus assembly protein CpaB
MGRRTILLVVAAVIAVAGAGMVYLYVQGADDRAKQAQTPIQVLKAVAQIEPGETLAAASEAGKIELRDVPAEQALDGAMAEIGESGALVALTRIFPNEQVTASKFGSPGEQDNLTVPPGKFAISVNLSDTGRVAGFVSPGSRVALFLNGTLEAGGQSTDFTRLLLPEVQVIAVAQTTVTTATTTTAEGAQTTESLPRTLFTLAVDQQEAERILFASTHGELAFGLLDDKSKVAPGNGITAQNLFR